MDRTIYIKKARLDTWILIVILSFLFFGKGIAQEISYEFKLYEITDGLADNVVYRVKQDSTGFLWIATRNGLSRFDSQSFVNFTNFDSTHYIRRNKINDLHIDDDNLIYLATDKGIDILDPTKGLISSVIDDSSDSLSLQGNDVQAIYKNSNNRLWVATPNKFAYQFTDDLIHFNYREPLESPDEFSYTNHEVYQFSEYNQDIYVRASQNQIWKLNKNGDVIDKFIYKNPFLKESLASPYGMCFDSKGKLWSIFLANGLVYLDEETEELIRHPISVKIKEAWKSKVIADSEDNLWIGGINLLYKFNPETDELLNLSQAIVDLVDGVQVSMFDLFIDKSGILWIATNLGLIRVTKQTNYFSHYFKGDPIRALVEAPDSSLFVGKYYTVEQLEPKSGTINPFPLKNYTEQGKRIFLMDPTSLIIQDSTLWMRGVTSYNLNSKKYQERETASYFDYVSIEDHTGKIWVAGLHMLSYYDNNTNTFLPYNDPQNILDIESLDISAIYQTEDRTIWLGTSQGLFTINYDNQQINPFLFADQSSLQRLQDSKINCFHEDEQNRLWMGTDGGGLFCMDVNTSQIQKFNTSNGLPSNYVYGILPESDSSLWFSTGNGLTRYNFSNTLFSNFNEEDGLLNKTYQKYAYLKTRNGTMYFGGNKGLDAFNPKDIVSYKTNATEANIVLTKYSKYSEITNTVEQFSFQIDQLNTINLHHSDRDIEFQFALLDHTDPEKHLYSHRLLGFSDKWSIGSSSNSVSYASLPPGNYTFEVRASTGKSKWNANILSIDVDIQQAWFRSPWFFMFLGFLFGALVFLYQRYGDLEKIKEKEKIELLRTKISHDLHDDVGGLLTGLTMQSELLELKAEGNSKVMANKIKHLGREALGRMRDTVWAMDANKDDVQSLFDRMKDHAELTLGVNDYSYDFNLHSNNLNLQLPPNIRQQTYLIFKESITNVAKHSNGSWVKIDVDIQDNNLKMKILDNGEPKVKHHSGVGIGSMKDRAKSIDGTLMIETTKGFEVRFYVIW